MDRDQVRHIAALARLHLDDAAIERPAEQLSAVLGFVETLRQLDLEGCEPTSFAAPEHALRDDVPNGRRLSNEAALAEAPEAEEGCFLVPPIVENVNP
jgi:aspartyl-tRNA(Asn)/glutamyl-tRNA(Gln) amidotransferase subunit C